jgi:hypothetical protein
MAGWPVKRRRDLIRCRPLEARSRKLQDFVQTECRCAAPFDPLLLRRIGCADLWLVLTGRGLTDLERAALATRVGVR